MFAELFAKPDKETANTPKNQKPKAKAVKPAKSGPKPRRASGQPAAPFEYDSDPSPEPAEADTLEYDWLEEEEHAATSDISEDDEPNYDATSLTDDEFQCGSIDSSPTFLHDVNKRTIKIERHRPPGIAVTFDDESWID